MISASCDANRRAARPENRPHVVKWWKKVYVLKVMAAVSTVITFLAVCYAFQSDAHAWIMRSRLTEENTQETTDSFSDFEEGPRTTGMDIATEQFKDSWWRNMTRKPVALRAIGRNCPLGCRSVCEYVCSKKGLPIIKPEMRITSTESPLPVVDHTHMLICVFRAVRYKLWPKKLQCTSYVYIRDTQWSNYERLYDFDRVQSDYKPDMNLLKADHMFNRARAKFPHAAWYLGFEGYRIPFDLNSTIGRKHLVDKITQFTDKRRLSDYLKRSAFFGIAFINTPLFYLSELENLVYFSAELRQRLTERWHFIYTVLCPQSVLQNPLAINKFTELGTHPRTHLGIHVNQIYNVDTWKVYFPTFTARANMPATIESIRRISQKIAPEKLCISISGILYYKAERTGLPELPIYVDRLSRLRITGEIVLSFSSSSFSEKLQRSEIYEHELLYGYPSFHEHIFHDTGASMLKKVTDILSLAYIDQNEIKRLCIVFDDIGEDSVRITVIHWNISLTLEPYELLASVVSAIEKKTGSTLWPQQ